MEPATPARRRRPPPYLVFSPREGHLLSALVNGLVRLADVVRFVLVRPLEAGRNTTQPRK
jgi:hypothetical protein